jgi:hypothetical protein
MSTIDDLRRLERDILRQGGDHNLRAANVAIVRGMIEAQEASDTTTVWWAETGPPPGREYKPGEPLRPTPRRVVDLTVVSDRLPVGAGAAQLGMSPETFRRNVQRADTEMLERGCKATIFISAGIVQTATTSIVVGPERRDR